MIVETGAGIVSGLAVNGVERFARNFAELLNSRSRMRRAVLGDQRASNEEVSNKILSELTHVYGSSGILDIVTDSTLQKIASSKLLSHLVSLVRLRVEPSHSLAMVAYIHLSSGADDLDEANIFAARLFSVLEAAIPVGLSHSRQPFSLSLLNPESEKFVRRREVAIAQLSADYVAAQNDSEIRERVERLKYVLEETHEQKIFRDISLNVYNQVDIVDVHGVDGNVRRIPLNDIFVEPNIFHIGGRGSFFEYRNVRYPNTRSIQTKWEDFYSNMDRAVVLGDPGGGKSTFSKKICLELADLAAKGGSVLPFFVQLRSYAAAKAQDPSVDIIQYISGMLKGFCPDVTVEDLKLLMFHWLKVGQCFVVFDGLDEVLTVSNRLSISQEISEFVLRYSLSRFLVTSRFVGYNTAPLEGFEHYGVAELQLDAIGQLFEKIFLHILEGLPREMPAKKLEFLSEAQSKASELISNPLLLTLIVIVHSRKREIPDNRADLYGHCTELLFERWDGYRDIKPNLPERYRLYDLLIHISMFLMEKEEYGGRISKSDLVKISKGFFISDYIDNKEGRASEAAALLVDHLVGRSWILHEVGEDVFEFTHRTFLEFFYAKSLESRFEKTEELIEYILKILEDGSKTVAAHLALQIKSKDKRAVSTKAANELAAAIYGTDDLAKVAFCVDALGYLLPEASSLSALVHQISEIAVRSGMGRILIGLLSLGSPLHEIISAKVWEHISSIEKISTVRALNDVLEFCYLQRMNSEEFQENCDSALKAWLSKIIPLQTRSAYACRVAHMFNGPINWTALKKHGNKFWSNVGLGRYRQDIRILFLEEIADAISKSQSDPHEHENTHIRLGLLTLGGVGQRLNPLKTTRGWSSPANFATLDTNNTTEELLNTYTRALALASEIEMNSLSQESVSLAKAILEMEEKIDEAGVTPNFLSSWINGDFSFFYNGGIAEIRRPFLQNMANSEPASERPK